jgi:hypothetical protein
VAGQRMNHHDAIATGQSAIMIFVCDNLARRG